MTQDSREKIDDWERFREFLLVLARVQTGTRWRGKLDLSGVVQQTLLEAYQAGRRLADVTDRQKAAWLKQVLTHNLADEVRKLTAARRDAGRERSLEAEMAESMSRLERLLPDGQSTPSRQAIHKERMLQVAQMLSSLPESQRRARVAFPGRTVRGRGGRDAGDDSARRGRLAPPRSKETKASVDRGRSSRVTA